MGLGIGVSLSIGHARARHVTSAPAWTPAQLSGVLLWLDAKKHATALGLATTDTVTVSAATDFAGVGDLTQATTAQKPSLIYGDGVRWGYDFDGVDDYIERTVSLTNVPFTLVFAWRSTQSSQAINAASFASATSSTLARGFQYDYSGTLWRDNARNSAGTAAVMLNGPATSLTPNLVAIDADGVNTRLFSNEVLQNTTTNPATGTFERFRFAGNRGLGIFCAMRLYGAVILDHQATDAERRNIESYFNTQAAMGLSLP